MSDWLFDKGVRSFDDMVNVPKSLRELLETHTTIGALEVAEEQVSKDGTVRVSTLRPLLTRSCRNVDSQLERVRQRLRLTP